MVWIWYFGGILEATKNRSYYTDCHVYSDYLPEDSTCFASKNVIHYVTHIWGKQELR